jgi:hypothetical protein
MFTGRILILCEIVKSVYAFVAVSGLKSQGRPR